MSEPPKFINENGVRKMNPAWKTWKSGGTTTVAPAPAAGTTADPNAPVVCVAPTMRNEATSLPVVSNMQQLGLLGADAQATPGFQQAAERYQSAAVAQQVGLSQDQMLDQLGRVFAKYEIPMGLLQKLSILESFQLLEHIVDDSGSMSCGTDSKHPDGRQMTRWEEVHRGLSQMLEVLAYIPFPPCHVLFLNRASHLVFQKNPGETPEVFIRRAAAMLNKEWHNGPSGSTPALERITESLGRHSGQAVIRYFWGDGTPNGGEEAQEKITNLLKKRANPSKNPFTFFSCTNNDADTEWMKNAEEVSPFCSEYDDFNDESEEIVNDQGKAMPYSYGMHLVGTLVGALCEDLDSMDEATPFTKTQMSELTGYHVTDQEYDFYFQEFLAAQSRKRPESKEDKIKAEYVKQWPPLKEEFRKAARSGDIPLVQEYRKKMQEAQESGCVIA